MTVRRVKQAAAIRGIYFSGVKKWLNNVVGYGYGFYAPDGRGYLQADTLTGAYKQVMSFDRLKKGGC